jgi:P-type E1-E2 ATPase
LLLVSGLAINKIELLLKADVLLFSSVVVSQATPSQKAFIVQILQKVSKKCVLAVGDGANDVSMIVAANVGVGIVGREGT